RAVEDPWSSPVQRDVRPRDLPEREHARGLAGPVRLDGQGENARRPVQVGPALAADSSEYRTCTLAAVLADPSDVCPRWHFLRRDQGVPFMSKAFITGANGFIARRLEALLHERGYETCGVDLTADPARDVVVGDITEPGPWQKMAAGCGLVLHTAAIVSN